MEKKIKNEADISSELFNGLMSKQKSIPSKYFYDTKGSQLFDKICELKEYYPTRTELKILEDNINEISEFFNQGSILVEFGSGSSLKTRILLRNLKNLLGYVPIDISANYLIDTVSNLKNEFPHLVIKPLVADYTKKLIFPKFLNSSEQKIVFFPGSTLGNFTRSDSRKFLETIRSELKNDDGFLLGIDLIKNKRIIELAYNDKKGITAEFNLNILSHLNKLYSANFDLNNYTHCATYNEIENRIEMYLVSKTNQEVQLGNHTISISEGEKILTEYSHKFNNDIVNWLCKDIFKISKIWKDDLNYFGMYFLSPI